MKLFMQIVRLGVYLHNDELFILLNHFKKDLRQIFILYQLLKLFQMKFELLLFNDA